MKRISGRAASQSAEIGSILGGESEEETSGAKALPSSDGFMYGLKPVPFIGTGISAGWEAGAVSDTSASRNTAEASPREVSAGDAAVSKLGSKSSSASSWGSCSGWVVMGGRSSCLSEWLVCILSVRLQALPWRAFLRRDGPIRSMALEARPQLRLLPIVHRLRGLL